MKNPHAASRPPTRALAYCATAYVSALAVAVGAGYAARGLHPVIIVLIADIAGMLVIFAFGRMFRNASFYDPYWSVAPPVIALYWVLGTAEGNADIMRQVLVVTLVFIWGLRLTGNWAGQWRGLAHEDWRYADLRKKTGRWFPLVELVGIELMPTLLVFLGCLSLYPALVTGYNPFGMLDVIAGIVTAGAILIETASDIQLKRFSRGSRKSGVIMDKGLWAYSRHPNYFGEVLFWWGLFLFALAAAPGYWWTVIGPTAITLLFFTVSIPLMEKRNVERRPGYAEHRVKTSAFFPWFRKA